MRSGHKLEVSFHGVTLFAPGKETSYFSLPEDVFEGAVFDLPKIKVSSLVLVANTRKAVVRLADVSPENISKSGVLRGDRWGFVQKTFPIGEKMNENTHIFDGNIFKNSNAGGLSRFFMTALPVGICDVMARIGIMLSGSIHKVKRLDTIEHILFRKYVFAADKNDSLFIFLPQSGGLRVLNIYENLPNTAFFISNNPAVRDNEFLRFYNSLGEKEGVRKKAILLNHEHDTAQNWQWVYDVLSRNNFEVSEKMLKLCD
ncbi:MAG: hypothetical protein FWF79_05260 [Defluviitaleaceae bacterium]|nr:hypothetical protein [Defluviitaleaceae bacterium]